MNHFSAVITGSTIVLAEVNDAGLTSWLIAEEARPESLAAADTMLAAHGYGRTEAWDLTGAGLYARVQQIDNLFCGTRAARLDQAVGTTHEPFEYDQARNVENGDLISDGELSEVYVAAATRTESDSTVIRMVREGGVWEDRFSGTFMPGQLVKRARRKA